MTANPSLDLRPSPGALWHSLVNSLVLTFRSLAQHMVSTRTAAPEVMMALCVGVDTIFPTTGGLCDANLLGNARQIYDAASRLLLSIDSSRRRPG